MSDTTEGSCGACTENLMETDAFIRSAVYKMDYKRRGLALIFNQEQFDCSKLEERCGTNVDRGNLEKSLRELNFEVEVYNDSKQKEVLDIITKAAKEDHSDADCFLLVFLSHGENDLVYAKDEGIMIRDITGPFREDKCQSLVGKPKIFVFQACRGDQYDDPVTAACIGSATKTNEVVEEECGLQTLPAGVDFIMCNSVAEGYVSWRNSHFGSWYIQDLCELLQKYGNSLEFTELLTLVSTKVSMRSVNQKAMGKKQVPCFASMLTKKLYFWPKK